MSSSPLSRLIRAIVALALAIALFLLPRRQIEGIDSQADRYFENAITQAGLSYATCRVINATVSVIGDSQVQLEPAGIGISLAAGKVLDPIDDMTERLSNVLVTAIVSLGIQKLAYEIGVSLAPQILAYLLLLFALFGLLPWHRGQVLQWWLLRLSALVLVARFLLPITSLINDYLLEHYFADEIEATTDALALQTGNFETLYQIEFPQYDGFFGTIENSAHFVRERAIALKDALGQITRNLGDIIENLLTLTWLFAALFLIQVILLPLGVLWLMVKAVNALFNSHLPFRPYGTERNKGRQEQRAPEPHPDSPQANE